MPIYEYAPASGNCKQCGGRFEVYQRVADDKLTQCPDCGQPCERVISAVALGGKYSTSDAKVKELGMTKYVKAGNGVYERTVGEGGPKTIHRKKHAV
jgi:putative FmdB family regulatory protein